MLYSFPTVVIWPSNPPRLIWEFCGSSSLELNVLILAYVSNHIQTCNAVHKLREVRTLLETHSTILSRQDFVLCTIPAPMRWWCIPTCLFGSRVTQSSSPACLQDYYSATTLADSRHTHMCLLVSTAIDILFFFSCSVTQTVSDSVYFN